jgi:hypothetical protein
MSSRRRPETMKMRHACTVDCPVCRNPLPATAGQTTRRLIKSTADWTVYGTFSEELFMVRVTPRNDEKKIRQRIKSAN